MTESRAVIVGAGPAGLGAALVLARRGVAATVLDETADLGGQGWHPENPHGQAAPRPSASRALGAQVLDEIEALRPRLDHRPGHSVVARFADGELAVEHGGSLCSLRPDALLLATGAHDRVLPFPGWTTPGVMGLGGVLSLLDRHSFAPSGPVVLAGAGPLLLLAAVRLVQAGHPPAAVLDCAGLRDLLPALPGLLSARALLAEGRDLLARLRRAGVPVQRRMTVVEAEGAPELSRVRVAPVDADWRPDVVRATWLEAGLLAVGHGLAPEAALAAQAGVELRWDNPAGGWVPLHGRDMATSVPGVWVAGDSCGVHGAPVAWLQGRRAGLAMAAALGAALGKDEQDARRLDAELSRALRARRGLEQAMQPRGGLVADLRDETIVCRCEEVPWSELRAWMDRGARGATGLKMATRAGMGRCQGRFCAGSLQALLAQVDPLEGLALEALTRRPPVRPVTLGALARWKR